MARVDTDSSVHVAATDLEFPNGAVITPDGRTMIVAETLGSRLTAFDIADDATLGNRRVWAALPGMAPDGICLNADGHVWVADANGSQCVLVAEGGTIVDTIATDQHCYACMLGGEDGRTLFLVTAKGSAPAIVANSRTGRIVMATVATPGAGRP
jgi:sugar lactone lactonase YvrE